MFYTYKYSLTGNVKMNFHMHRFKFDSGISRGHMHKVRGMTEYMIGFNNFHFHVFSGVSSYTSHTHYFSGISGLPIKTENGHIHKMDGILESNNGHEHEYNNYSFEEISYISGKSYGEVYI
jgi:hypothetical protein